MLAALGGLSAAALACSSDTQWRTQAKCETTELTTAGVQVARTEAEWRALRLRLSPCDGALRLQPDLGREQVVVLAHGYAGSGGHRLSVDSGRADAARTFRVWATWWTPGDGCGVAASVSYPAVVALLPADVPRVQLTRRAAAAAPC